MLACQRKLTAPRPGQILKFMVAIDMSSASSAMDSKVVCPVLSAWSADETLKARLGGKWLVILTGNAFSRDTIVQNRTLLIPLIQQLGVLTAPMRMA